MFSKIKRACEALRILGKVERAAMRGSERGLAMGDKSTLASVTVWGGILVAAGSIIVAVGRVVNGEMQLADAWPIVAQHVGYALAIIGGRRAIGRLLDRK